MPAFVKSFFLPVCRIFYGRQIVRKNNTAAAVVESGTPLITDVQSALELMMTVKYETGCTRFAVNKEALTEDFFILSTGVAGEILQKFINYGVKFAIYGDFSGYTSKPLRDFMYDMYDMYESNLGWDIFSQPCADLAVEKLCGGTGEPQAAR